MSLRKFRLLPSGDSAVVIDFGNAIDKGINALVMQLCDLVISDGKSGIREAVPTYRSLLVYYDPLQVSWEDLCSWLNHLVLGLTEKPPGNSKTIVVPTCYGGEFGPDMQFVSLHTGLTEDEIIRIHSSADYHVYMMGFTPGYPYMGGMDSRLSTPRLPSPRLKTKEGSVGIAGTQTGIYSVESPGGWRIIGRTPLRLFDPASSSPFLLEAGCRVRYRPISPQEYNDIVQRVASRAYTPEVHYERNA